MRTTFSAGFITKANKYSFRLHRSSKNVPKPTAIHHDLIALYPELDSLRVVTGIVN